MCPKRAVHEEKKHQHIAGLLSDCSHWCLPGVPNIWNEMLSSVVFKFLNQSCITNVTLTTFEFVLLVCYIKYQQQYTHHSFFFFVGKIISQCP